MKKKVFSLKLRIIALIGFLLLCQGSLIWTAMSKSGTLLSSFKNATEKEMPATKYSILIDMRHDSVHANVLNALYLDSVKKNDQIAEVAQEMNEQVKEFNSYFDQLESLDISAADKENIESTKATVKQYLDTGVGIIADLQKGKTEQTAVDQKKFEELFKKLEVDLASLSSRIQNDVKLSGDQGKDIVQAMLLYSMLGFVVSLVVGFTIFIWTKKSFDSLLKSAIRSAQTINGLSNEVTVESSKLKDSTVEQSAAIQQSVSALSEMSSMIAQTAQNVKMSLETSEGAQNKASEGQQIMERMTHSMDSIQKANSQLQGISKVIEDINSKTAIINDIVFKTQLLSFNASIEAARAGQHGRGFAVVAEEVGNLAELSGQAAKDIELLLGDSQRQVKETLQVIEDRVSDGHKVSQLAMVAFDDISKNIGEINSQVKSINEATQQQEIGIQQTNAAMKQIDVSSHNNTEASSIALSKADELHQHGQELEVIVDDLLNLVNGSMSHYGFQLNLNQFSQKTESASVSAPEDSLVANDDIADLVQQISNKKVSSSISPKSGEVVDRKNFKRVA